MVVKFFLAFILATIIFISVSTVGLKVKIDDILFFSLSFCGCFLLVNIFGGGSNV